MGGGGGGAGMGGAVFNNGGTVTISNSTLVGNTVSGGGGTTAGRGLGGGIFNASGASGTMTVINTTFTGNSADSGGGLFSYNGVITVTNNTFSGNTADQGGRGIFITGDGLNAIALINNTIIAQSDTLVSDLQTGGFVVIVGQNDLIGTASYSIFTTVSYLNNLTGNPLLGPLQNYGGPTSTMALLPGSPAINAGINALAVDSLGNPLTTDQRGVLRTFGSRVDIGAYELQSFRMVVSTTADGITADSALSLREALALANGSLSYSTLSGTEKSLVAQVSGNANTITFASNLNGTLTLSTVGDTSVGSSAFLVNSTVSIDGTGGNGNLTLSAAGTAMRLFNVTSTGSLTLQDLTLTGGTARGYAGGSSASGGGGGGAGLGGAILNQGTLVIQDSTLTGNTVVGGAGGANTGGTGGGAGGAGLNVAGNSATTGAGASGGGPAGGQGGAPGASGKNGGNGTAGGYASGGGGGGVTGFSGGRGGRGGDGGFGAGGGGGGSSYYGYGGTGGFGGGGGGNSSFGYLGYGAIPPGQGGYGGGGGGGRGNRGTGGGGGGAGLGGAVFNKGGTVTITNSTLVGNTAQGGVGGAGGAAGSGVGGGLFNVNGNVTVSNTTLSGNSAANGGGLFNYSGTLTVTNVTISGNSATNGGGLLNFNGVVMATNVTISANSATSGGGLINRNGTVTLINTIVASQTSGGNVVGALTAASSNNVLTGNAMLAPLGSYGGSTQTMALLTGSPAIDTGTSVGAPATDQRGFTRVGAIDIGAFQAATLVVNSTGDVSLAGPGKLSLRVAVNLANLQAGADTITFDPTVFGTPRTITLTGGALTLTDTATTTITGLGAALVAVNGNNANVVFDINFGASVALSGLAITGGSGTLGGGVKNNGTATLSDITLTGNSVTGFGGGFYNSGTATLINCTLSGNTARFGGGVYNVGTATLINCTVSGNSASVNGGGMYHAGVSATLLNTIVAGNTAPTNVDIQGRFTSQGFNLIGNIGASTGWISTDLTNRNPLLGPLGYYGGLTLTMPLLAGSPAINAGTSVGAPVTDERGFGRFGQVDIGAYEVQASAPLVVNTNTDVALSAYGKLDLRTAVNLANIQVGDDTITFDPSVFSTPKTITLTFGVLTLTDAAMTTITGTGAGKLAVSGNHVSGVFQVNADANAMLSGLTITAGSAGVGGGVANFGTVTLTDCIVSGNFGFNGGGLINFGTVALTNSTVSGNSAGTGGGLLNTGGATATLTNSTVSGNTVSFGGGGVFNDAGSTVTLTNSTVSGNTASIGGGGLLNAGTATLTSSAVSGNSTPYGLGGGIYNAGVGVATLTDCTVSGNTAYKGGGVYNGVRSSSPGTSPTIELTNSTISGNYSRLLAGGLLNIGTATLTNCTVSGNSSGRYSGGLHNFGTATLTSCTVSGNYANRYGGMDNSGGSATLLNTIVAGNTSGVVSGRDVEGRFSSPGFNLIGVDDSNDRNAWQITDQIIGFQDPMLGPLGYYGGLTQTMPLLANSPAIGRGTFAGTPITDQRGFGRFSPDIGAYAFQYNLPLVVNTTADGEQGKLDLRGAINLANVQNGADTIAFDPIVFSTPQTITLTSGPITFTDTDTTTITSLAAGLLTVSGNHASQVFQISAGASATLSGLTITAGSALFGGGVNNAGTVVLTDCTISGSTALVNGGGVYNTGTATLTNCTVSANSSQYRSGGVYNQGTLTLTNCTVSGNSAVMGGGMYNSRTGIATLTNCTVSANTAFAIGGGVVNSSGGGTVTLLNTIIAGNTLTLNNFGIDAVGGFISTGRNLIGIADGSFGWTASDLIGNIPHPLDPLLAPLGNYGGPTQTMALLTGSPAINAGTFGAGTLPTDQRGMPRNDAPDIGAFEYYTPSSQTITFNTLAGKTYGNADFAIGATASSGLSVTFTASGKASVYQVAGTGVWYVHILGAGSAAVTAHQVGNPIVAAAADVTQNFSIAKGTATVSVSGYTVGYDKLAHGATGTASGIGGESAGTLNLGSSFTNVPGGTAHWVFTGNGNYNDQNGDVAIVITKADATVNVTGYTGVYDALAHGATGTASGIGGEAAGTLNLGSSFTNVPGGTAHWVFTGNGNYKDQSGDAAIVITRADATVAVTGYTGVYDASAHGATGTASGIGGESAGTLNLGLSFTNVPGGTAHWVFTGNGNYNDQNGDVPIVITKATASIAITGYSVTFDGNTHTATRTATGVGGVDLSAGLTLVGTTHTYAGAYNGDAWSFAGGVNYFDANGTVNDSIAKASSTTTVSLPAGPFVWTGSQLTPATVTVSGAGGLSLTPTASYTNNVNVGLATASYAYGGDANHLSSSDSKNFTIIPAVPTVISPTATKITSTIATLGGNVTISGGVPLLKRGILYVPTSINSSPTLHGAGVIEVDASSTATGVLTQNVTGLIPNTAYSFVAFATNVQGTGYSPVGTFSTTILGPLSAITGPTSGRPGQMLTFVLNGYDPAPGMQLNGFVFHIKWGDGKTDAVTAINGTTINHTYASTGTYVIQVSATDGRGSTLPTGTWTVVISSAATPGARLATGGAGVKQTPAAGVSMLAATANMTSSKSTVAPAAASTSTSASKARGGSTTMPPVSTTAATSAQTAALDAALAEWVANHKADSSSLDLLAAGSPGYDLSVGDELFGG